MKQNTASSTVSDYLLKSMWICCRLVGIINAGYFIFVLFSLVIYAMLMADSIRTNCKACRHFNGGTFHFMCLMYIKHPVVLCAHVVTIFITIIGCLKMVYVNNGLRSTEIPSDGKYMKTWLYYHTVFIVLCLIILLLSGNLSGYNTLKFFEITVVVQIIEIFVVGKFYTKYKMSADHHNRSFQI